MIIMMFILSSLSNNLNLLRHLFIRIQCLDDRVVGTAECVSASIFRIQTSWIHCNYDWIMIHSCWSIIGKWTRQEFSKGLDSFLTDFQINSAFRVLEYKASTNYNKNNTTKAESWMKSIIMNEGYIYGCLYKG